MNLQGKTNEELLALQQAIESNPENRRPPDCDSIWLHTKQARKKIDEISRQITSNLENRRKALGLPINTDGYSGRQTNRRR